MVKKIIDISMSFIKHAKSSACHEVAIMTLVLVHCVQFRVNAWCWARLRNTIASSNIRLKCS